MLTPFNEKDELDLEIYEKNLAAQVAAGVHGIVIGGSLGEASTITEKETSLAESGFHLPSESFPSTFI